MKAKILLIEDDASVASALKKELQSAGYSVEIAVRGDAGVEQALTGRFDVVVTDMKMPGLNGIEVVKQLHAAKPKLPILLITAHGTTDSAIEAMKAGAFEYVLKPFDVGELMTLIAKAVQSSRLMLERVEMGETASGPAAIIGKSRPMQEIYKQIGRIAATPVTVLVLGETGTGKEMVARAIYHHSDRADKPFIAVNCAAIPDTLLESELFGHERGSFTGANERRIGRFEQAQGGTLFLDEIGDLSLNTQAKLLRVLQEKYIQRVGGKEAIPVDVRIIAATHHDLQRNISEKLFREDLYYRLSAVTIQLPPLSQRAEDIPALVRFFLGRHSTELGISDPGIQAEAIDELARHNWPGNVRELENVVREAVLSSRGFPISQESIQTLVSKVGAGGEIDDSISCYLDKIVEAAHCGETSDIYRNVIEHIEKELFTKAIHRAGGNQAKAARWLGVTRTTMREKLHRFGIVISTDGERI